MPRNGVNSPPAQPTGEASPPANGFLPAGILFLAAFLTFLPSLRYDFLNWDDQVYIHKNPWLLNFSAENALGIFRHSFFSNYAPLTILSYMADLQWSGYHPAGYRLVNILLHAGTVAAAYGLFRALGAARMPSFLLLLFFAVHPLRIESVVWISERKDVLCAFFYVLSAWCWAAAAKRRGAALLAASVACFLLSLLSKAMAVSLPFVLLLHDALLAREGMRRRLPLLLLMFALSGAFMWLNLNAQTEAVASYITLGQRMKMVLYAPLHYALKTLLPIGISPLYPFESAPFHRLFPAAAAVAFDAANVAVLGWLVWRAKAKAGLAHSTGEGARPALAILFGVVSAAIILAPVSGIVPFGAAFAADRYSYLPTLFLFLGGAVALGPVAMGRARVIPCLLACVAALAWTLFLLPAWRDSGAVWRRVLALYPESPKAQVNAAHAKIVMMEGGAESAAPAGRPAAGAAPEAAELEVFALIEAGKYDQAEAAAREMDDPAMSQYWLMRAYGKAGRAEEEAKAARSLIGAKSASDEQRAWGALSLARAGHDADAESVLERIPAPTMMGGPAWGALAENAARRGDWAKSEYAAWRALRIFPAEPAAVRTLGARLIAEHRFADAEPVLYRAARHPAAGAGLRAWALFTLAKQIEKDDPARAKKLSSKALAIEPPPDDPPAERARVYAFLGFVAEDAGDPAKAAEFYDKAITQDPSNAEALQNRAILYLQSKKLDEGIKLLERAAIASPADEAIRRNLETARREKDAEVGGQKSDARKKNRSEDGK